MKKRQIQNTAVITAALAASLAAIYANTDWFSTKPNETKAQERCYGKVEFTAALTTPETLAKAIQQNYVNTQERETRMAKIVAGLENPVNLVVLFPLPDMGKPLEA